MSRSSAGGAGGLRQSVAGVDPSIRALLPGYLENRRSDAGELLQAVERRDQQLARRLGHNLKGSGAAYGLPQFSSLGAELERAALDERWTDMESLLGEYDLLLRELDAALMETED